MIMVVTIVLGIKISMISMLLYKEPVLCILKLGSRTTRKSLCLHTARY